MVRRQSNSFVRLFTKFAWLVGVAAVFFVVTHVHAQAATDPGLVQSGNVGLTQVQQVSGLGSESFSTIVGRILRIILTLLGVVMLGIFIYGGFLWMTNGGSADKVEKAKKTMVNGVIGLVIVLSAYAITEFIMRSISNATGTQVSNEAGVGTGQNENGLSDNGFNFGSAVGSLGVKGISPRGTQKIANLQVAVTFTTPVDETSARNGVSVTDASGAKVDGSYTVSGDTVVFVPSANCPAPNTKYHCFQTGKQYTITVKGGKDGVVTAATKKSLTCTDATCKATFTPGEGVDATGPNISNYEPHDLDKVPVDQIIPIQALLRDDNAIGYGRAYVDGILLESVQVAANKAGIQQELLLLSKKFNTKGDAIKKTHEIKVFAYDVAGNSSSITMRVTVAPQTCFNKVKDGDELDIDCSPPNGACGLCSNAACSAPDQCANGNVCKSTTCLSSPVIKNVQPKDGAPGSFITITGTGFGSGVGEVTFVGDPKDPKDDKVAALACGKSWDINQVVVVVPEGAKSGAIRLHNLATSDEFTDDQDGLYMPVFAVNDVQRPGLCAISPSSGVAGKTKVSITGNDALAQANVSRQLFFGGYVPDIIAWSDGAPNVVSATVPNMDAGTVDVGVVIKGLASNPVQFMVTSPVSAAAGGTGSGSGSNGTGGSTGSNGSGSGSSETPTISSFKPSSGGAGQYVTVIGSGFGTTPNKVYFIGLDTAGAPNGEQVPADISFPPQCAKTFWTSSQIVVKVPTLTKGAYAIAVYPYGKANPVITKTFTVTADQPGPEICALVPSQGPADGTLTVKFYGDNLGTNPGKALFAHDALGETSSQVSGWTKTSASIVVPKGAATGDVRLVLPGTVPIAADTCAKNPNQCSNPLIFTVLDCRATANSCTNGTMCCGDGSCQKDCSVANKPAAAVFAWCFSTGDSCDATVPPSVVEECSPDAKAAVIPSPSPADVWQSTKTSAACTNAMISLKFSEALDPQTVTVSNGSQSSLLVEECTGDAPDVCSRVAPQPISLSDVVITKKVDAKYAGLFAIPHDLKPDTTYRVTLTSAIRGFDSGLPLTPPKNSKSGCVPGTNGVYCYTFTTAKTTEACAVDSVGVAPTTYTADNLGAIYDILSSTKALQMWIPLAYPSDKCQVLNPNAYHWAWSPAKSGDTYFDFTSSLQASSVKSAFVAKQPTKENSPVEISVTETGSKKSGKGTLAINPGVPLLYEQCEVGGIRSPSPSTKWSGGTSICPDALVSVEFNQPVVGPNNGNIDFKLWECQGTEAGKECNKVVSTPVAATLEYKAIDPIRHRYVLAPDKTLAVNTTYLVEIATSTKGLGVYGKSMPAMKGCRAGVGYCYTFKTAPDMNECKVKSVEVDPGTWNATDYGVQQLITETGDSVDKLWYANPIGNNACVYLKNGYDWFWGIDKAHQEISAIDPNNTYPDNGATQTVAAYRDTVNPDVISILASTQGITGRGTMTVHFPNPTVVSFFPQGCGAGAAVCQNALVGAEFVTDMNLDSFAGHAFLYECPAGDTNCPITDVHILSKSAPLQASAPRSAKLVVLTPGAALKPDTTYRVLLVSGITSTAYKPFTAFNYAANGLEAFTWAFTTSKEMCVINKVSVAPADAVAQAQGQVQKFVVEAFGAPTSCQPDGEKLNAKGYQWNWSTSDAHVAAAQTATTSPVQSFKMIGSGPVIKNVQTAVITAATASKSGTATWKLQCNAPPATCPNGTFAGSDHCCHQAPQITAQYPKPGDSNVCRNTMITVDVNDQLDSATVNTSTIAVGFKMVEGDTCPGGSTDANGYCFGTIPFSVTAANTIGKDAVSSAKIAVNLNVLLPGTHTIRVMVLRNPDTQPKTPAVTSKLGVPLVGQTWDFHTAATPCELNDVSVFPNDSLFTKLTDAQNVLAFGQSKQGNALVPISQIKDRYDWSWKWFTGSKKVALFKQDVVTPASTMTPGGSNGQTGVTALAKITVDEYFKPTTVGKTVAGTGSVTAALCETPWFAEQQSVLAGKDGILDKNHLSFWYCQDNGKSLLPKVSVVQDDLADKDLTALVAFRLLDPNATGAIGFRVEKNLKYYSPLEWYYQKEFNGEVVPTTVDGFDAVRVGNTLYIGFGNQVTSPDGIKQYSNILVVSLAQQSSAELTNIFNQIVSNLQFATNVNDVGLCSVSGQTNDQQCLADSDCTQANGQTGVCGIDQTKFRRDMIRAVHAAALTRALGKAQAVAGKYPIIAQGTFVPGLVSSKWEGWNSFMQQLGSKSIVDPVNAYGVCGAGYDVDTCWNSQSKKYSCTTDSLVYHYQTVSNGADYTLGIPLEQAPALQNAWQGEWKATVGNHINTAFCTGKEFSPQSICGDGVIGPGEQCDPAGSPVSGTDANTCPKYGLYTGSCSKTCQIENKVCVNQCGDGIKQPSEACDDGKNFNGKYNHCSADCSKLANDLGACGDGVVQKNETCDIGTPAGKVFLGDGSTVNSAGNSIFYGLRCTKTGDTYEAVAYNSQTSAFFPYSPKFPWKDTDTLFLHNVGDLCGGKVATGYGTCSNAPGVSCVANTNCPTGSVCVKPTIGTKYAPAKTDSCNWDCKAFGSYCGDGTVNKENGEECDGDQIDTANQCVRKCIPPGSPNACRWASKATDGTVTCEALPKPGAGPTVIPAGCGDGVLSSESGEECDAGLDCANVPIVNGKYTKPCKQGGTNGVACVPNYGANNSCQYCTTSCKKSFVSGGYCGDGVKNGTEACDKNDTLTLNAAGKDYNSYVCAATCAEADKTAGGTTFNCATETGLITAGEKAPNPITVVKNSAITFTDDSIGWLPAIISATASYNKADVTSSNGTPVNLSSFPLAGATGLPVNTLTGFKLDMGRPYATNKFACFADGKSYTLQAKQQNNGSAGGAFNYTIPAITIDSADKVAQTVPAVPVGFEGDYRIVISGPVSLVTADITPQSAYATKTVMPASSYNLGSINFQDVTPAAYVGCPSNGYGAKAGEAATRTLFNNAIKNDVALVSWGDGCVSKWSFAQMEYAKAYAQDGAATVAGSERYVATLRRAFTNGYYAANYSFRVFTSSAAATKLEIWYAQTDSQWKKVAELHPADTDIQNGVWKAFHLQPQGVVTSGSSVVATAYKPEDALFAGVFDPTQTDKKLPLLP